MPPRTPSEVHAAFARAFFAHDADGVLALYDPAAVMVPAPGESPVQGHAAIRQALAGLLALDPRDGEVTTVFALEQDGIALLRSRWHFTATLPDGNVAEMSGSGVEVVQRQPDGTWVQVLDDPWGADDNAPQEQPR